MQISGLNPSNSFSASDVLAIEIDGTTYKLAGSTLATALKSIGNFVSTSDYPITVPHGGSGLTASPSMLTNLASTTAANVFQASPRPGVTGTLGIPHGGTNATTAQAARSNLAVPTTLVFSTATWSNIRTKLLTINNTSGATFYASDSSVVSLLTDGAVTSSLKGLITRLSDTTFDFLAMVGAGGVSGQLITWRISNLTESSATVGTVTQYDSLKTAIKVADYNVDTNGNVTGSLGPCSFDSSNVDLTKQRQIYLSTYGNVCMLSFQCYAATSIPNTGTILATGLPVPILIQQVVGLCGASGTFFPVNFFVNSNGRLTTGYMGQTIAAGQAIRIGVTYITQ